MKDKKSWPDLITREKLGDVLHVGGEFFHEGTLVLRNISYPVKLSITISKNGIRFSKVKINDRS